MQVFDTAPSSALTHNLIVYSDGSGGITGMGGRSAVGSFFGNNSKQSVRVYREVELNRAQILANKIIHEQNPTARSCVDTLKHHIFSDAPELFVDGKRIDMEDSFRRLYQAEWLPFLSAFFDECCIKVLASLVYVSVCQPTTDDQGSAGSAAQASLRDSRARPG